MNREAAAEALHLYLEIEQIQARMRDVQSAPKSRIWNAFVCGEIVQAIGADTRIITSVIAEPPVIASIIQQEDLDRVLMPLFVSIAQNLINQKGDRLHALGFTKPAGCL